MGSDDRGVQNQGSPRVLENTFQSIERAGRGNALSRLGQSAANGLSKIRNFFQGIVTSIFKRGATPSVAPMTGRANAVLNPSESDSLDVEKFSRPYTGENGETIDLVHAEFIKHAVSLQFKTGFSSLSKNAVEGLRQRIEGKLNREQGDPGQIVEREVRQFVKDSKALEARINDLRENGTTISMMGTEHGRMIESEIGELWSSRSNSPGDNGISGLMYDDLHRANFNFGEHAFKTDPAETVLEGMKAYFTHDGDLDEESLGLASKLSHQGIFINLLNASMIQTGKLLKEVEKTAPEYTITQAENGNINVTASKFMQTHPDNELVEVRLDITIKPPESDGDAAVITVNDALITISEG